MEFIESRLEGCFLIKPAKFSDLRGEFVKTFNDEEFRSRRLTPVFKEQYYSSSNKDVIRGMHFQLPPYDHDKLVYCTAGRVLDVLVDLRKDSATFGEYYSVELSADNAHMMYISKGIAHGFLTLSESATMIYNVTSVYHSEFDTGISWDSFNFRWPVANPIMSERDQALIPFDEFKSPFVNV